MEGGGGGVAGSYFYLKFNVIIGYLNDIVERKIYQITNKFVLRDGQTKSNDNKNF